MSEHAEQQKRHRSQARVGLASNIVGLGAGVAALGAAAKSPQLRRKVGSYVPATKRKMITRGSKGLAVGAVGLQAANTGGDVVTNLVLQRESKRKVSKMDSVAKSDGGSVGRRIDVEKGAGKFLGDATGLRTKKLAAGARTLESSAADARARAATFAPGRRQNRVARDAKSKTAAAERVEAARTASARSGNKTRAIAGGTAVGAAGLYGAGYQSGGRRRPADQFGKANPAMKGFGGAGSFLRRSPSGSALKPSNAPKKAPKAKNTQVPLDGGDVLRAQTKRELGFDVLGKANRESPSAGRLATAVAVPGIHGLVAGDKASGKLKSAGSQVGGSYLVGIPAGLAAMKLGGGRFASQAATAGGGAAGAIGATHLAHRKGWLKPQKKKVAKARSFDPEADRQRRTGAYAGTAAGGSIVAGREAARYIKLKDAKTGAKGVFAPKGKGKQALAWSAGSAGLAAVSAGTYKRGVSRRNQPWN